jgi:hypothetical protein
MVGDCLAAFDGGEPLEKSSQCFARRAPCAADFDRFEDDAFAATHCPTVQATHVGALTATSRWQRSRSVGEANHGFVQWVDHGTLRIVGVSLAPMRKS